MAAISDVLIARMALSHIGASTNIELLSENTPEAKQSNLWFTFARKQSLEAFDWDFARKRQALALHGDAAPDGVWSYRYQYPSDCISARRIENPTLIASSETVISSTDLAHVIGTQPDTPAYDVEISTDGTKSILTDIEDAILIYTFDLTNLTLWSPMSIEMFSRALAARIAFALTGNLKIAETQFSMFLALKRAAETSNANQQKSKAPRDAEWIRGR